MSAQVFIQLQLWIRLCFEIINNSDAEQNQVNLFNINFNFMFI